MSAVFQFEDAFTITGRGLVITGQIVEGIVRIGDRVRLPLAFVQRITGIDMGDGQAPDGSQRSFIGLLLGELPPREIALVRSGLAPGQRLEIESGI